MHKYKMWLKFAKLIFSLDLEIKANTQHAGLKWARQNPARLAISESKQPGAEQCMHSSMEDLIGRLPDLREDRIGMNTHKIQYDLMQ